MWVIAESITAGLIISLINKYVISKDIFQSCKPVYVEEDNNDISSVSTSISDSSSIHHIHV
jgi:lipoate-protein ligase B